MRFSYKITLIFIFLAITPTFSQEKLKGNKVVITEDRNISDFTKIEVIDDIEVLLVYNEKQSVSVEADSNLQPVILTSVKNDVLTIRTDQVIGRSKGLTVHLKVNKNITEISTYNEAYVGSNNSIVLDSLTINAFDSSEINLKLNTKSILVNGKGTSKLNFEILSTNVLFKTEGTCETKATINTQNITIDILDKAVTTLLGNTTNLEVDCYSTTSFKGKDFASKNATVKANNSATVFVNASDALTIYSNNTSEINIYANPIIVIKEFYDKALIRKKELN
jgi:hypothetical protein